MTEQDKSYLFPAKDRAIRPRTPEEFPAHTCDA